MIFFSYKNYFLVVLVVACLETLLQPGTAGITRTHTKMTVTAAATTLSMQPSASCWCSKMFRVAGTNHSFRDVMSWSHPGQVTSLLQGHRDRQKKTFTCTRTTDSLGMQNLSHAAEYKQKVKYAVCHHLSFKGVQIQPRNK